MENINNIPFWEIYSSKVNISPSMLYEFLGQNGFGRYYPDAINGEQNSVVVFENKNIIEQVSVPTIWQFCTDYIRTTINEDKETQKRVLDAFHAQSSVFKELSMYDLPVKQYEFIEDSQNIARFCFKNGVAVVTPDKIEMFDYSKFEQKVIWKSKIVSKAFTPRPLEEVQLNSEYYKFFQHITYNKDVRFSEERLKNLITLNGYLLHRYKNPVNSKAVIFMEENINDFPEGGTGKGLIMRGIKQLRNVVIVDGKNFAFGSQFAFQMISLDTDILFIDDIHDKFNFEKLFSLITEGATVEKKYKDRFTLPFDKSPKVAIATNYAVLGEGSSFDRRRWEFELSNHYNDSYTPFEEFGHAFFNDWNNEQWNLFYNHQLISVQDFLKNGVITSAAINIKTKRLMAETSPEFVQFFDNRLMVNKEYNKKTQFTNFKSEFSDYYHLKQREFTVWLRKLCKNKGLKIHEWHSNSDYYFKIIPG